MDLSPECGGISIHSNPTHPPTHPTVKGEGQHDTIGLLVRDAQGNPSIQPTHPPTHPTSQRRRDITILLVSSCETQRGISPQALPRVAGYTSTHPPTHPPTHLPTYPLIHSPTLHTYTPGKTKGEGQHDTIGLLVRDAQGNLAAGTSTSGWRFKHPGRVGDSPLVGSGLYGKTKTTHPQGRFCESSTHPPIHPPIHSGQCSRGSSSHRRRGGDHARVSLLLSGGEDEGRNGGGRGL